MLPGGGGLSSTPWAMPAAPRPADYVALASPAPALTPAPVSRPTPATAADNRVAAVVQREINAFILDTLGKIS